MDRGFNFSLFQGNRSNFGHQGPNFRERADRSDRRYDDFYADRNRGPPGGGPNRNGVRRNQDWNGGPHTGFVNPAVQAGVTGGISGPVLSAIQQQSILNALMTTQAAKNFLPPNQNQNMMGQNRQPRYQGGSRFTNNRRGSGGGGPRTGEKRKTDAVAPSGFNKQGRKFPAESPAAKKKTGSTAKDSPKKEKEEPKVEEIDIPDDEVEVPDSLMDSVEKLRQRKEVERNVADEDVQKLMVFCFTGKGYQCKTCGLLLMKESAFLSHLMGKSHVMNVIDARTAKKYQEIRDILEIDLTPDDWFEKNENARAIIMKQSKLHMKTQREIKQREEANYNKTPSNFFNFNMELRKSVTKKDDKVVITSLVESTVEVKDFTGEKFFGCEFVRAVTGFHCRLCSINIREARGVLPHVDSRQHKNNYAAYIRKNAEYEKTQKEQNQDLFDIMSQHEDKSVVLAESTDVEKSHFLSLLDPELVRIPSVMNPELKKEKEEKEKKEKEAAAAAAAAEEKAAAEAEAAADGDDSKDDDQEAEGEEQDAEQEEGGEDAADEEQEGEEEEAEEVAEEDQAEEVDAEEEEPMEQEENDEEESKEKEEEAAEDVTEETDDPYAETTETASKKAAAKPGKSILKQKAAEKAADKPAEKPAAKTPTTKKSKAKSTPKSKKAVAAAAPASTEETTDAVPEGFEVVDEVEDDATV